MGIIKNLRADRSSGKKQVAKLHLDDVKQGIHRSPEEQKTADKAAYDYGYYKSKSARDSAKAMPKTKTVGKSKTNTTTINNEANGVKIENPSVFGKQPKSSKPTSKPGKAKKK